MEFEGSGVEEGYYKVLCLTGGVTFPELNEAAQYSLQKSILTVMLQIENSFVELGKINAKNGIKSILICDRGAMDPSAYMPRDLWLKMLNELGLDEVELRDSRYDVVVHLVTAAKGAESFYTLENNGTRTEGLELARTLDHSTMKAWLGHASFQVIDNDCEGFNDKCNNVVQAVSTRLGIKADKGKNIKKRKFLVKNIKEAESLTVPYKEFIVEHRFLVNSNNDGIQTRIRKRSEEGSKTVHYTITKRIRETEDQKRIEKRRILTPREYDSLLDQVDPLRAPIVKRRRCFLFEDIYYQIDFYQSPRNDIALLEAYVQETDENINLPNWLDLEEVTHHSAYSMYNLSLNS